MANTIDKRPPVAVGHVCLPVKNVLTTSAFLQQLGLRKIFEKDTFAVLELRGGTHLVLEKSRKRTKSGTQAPVDFMVDDVKQARSKYAKMGMKPTRIKSGCPYQNSNPNIGMMEPAEFRHRRDPAVVMNGPPQWRVFV